MPLLVTVTLPVCLHFGVLRLVKPDRIFPPNTDLVDKRQEVTLDLFTYLSREAVKTLHHSVGLLVPQSAYDGSRLAIPCPGTGPLSRFSSSPPLHQAAKLTSSSRRKTRQHGATSCSSASKEEFPMSVAATAGLRGAVAVQPTPGLRSAAAVKPTSGLQSAFSPCLPHLHVADASAPVIKGLCDASGPAPATEGLCDASGPAPATEGLGNASAPVHATEGLGAPAMPPRLVGSTLQLQSSLWDGSTLQPLL
ncbi:hypothetical protein CRENBAI_019541 [Crenichthys baileyi]|uniref:Uncharacterized protein n=1 Tax=Crenichthys baileyi TaxID=28760 RepID=A0AAV9R3Q1_9TELE